MKYPTLLFVAPKQGGILQSSGFLDLKSLMALRITCKAHAYDELSLIQLTESELSRNRRIHTIEEAIALWRKVYRNSVLKQWLERDSPRKLITVTRNMLSEAVIMRYEVMLPKMLRKIPQSERLSMVQRRDSNQMTLLHSAAESGNLESIKIILDLYPELERLQAVKRKDMERKTVLHHAAYARNTLAIKLILPLYPESERLEAVHTEDRDGWTILNCAGRSGNLEAIRLILSLLPESHRLQAICSQDRKGRTVLHCLTESGDGESIKHILTLFPESQRSRAMYIQDGERNTVLQCLNEETRDSIMTWLPRSDSSSNQKRSYNCTLQTEWVDVEQTDAKRQKSEGTGS